MHEQATTQLIDVGDAVHLFDLEDVLDHVFEQGFVDPKLRSVVWWEDCTSVRLQASSTVQDLLACGAGSTPETALRLVIGLYFFSFMILQGGLINIKYQMQWMPPRLSGCIMNTSRAYIPTPRPSACASIQQISSVSS